MSCTDFSLKIYGKNICAIRTYKLSQPIRTDLMELELTYDWHITDTVSILEQYRSQSKPIMNKLLNV